MSEIIKPPFHYIGNKYKQMQQILDLLPEKMSTFVDVFGGSGVVAYNVAARKMATIVNYSDKTKQIVELHENINRDRETFMSLVRMIETYHPDTRDGYLSLRKIYNSKIHDDKLPQSVLLYGLICRSFSNDIRFNKSGGFNMPYGERNYLDLDRIKNLPYGVNFFNFDFRDIIEFQLDIGSDTLFFIDPPYFGTTATYNSGWTERDEKDLYQALKEITEEGQKWMLTSTLENRGKVNNFLKDFIDNSDVNVYDTGIDYGNSSFRKSDKKSREVIVTNYEKGEVNNDQQATKK